MFNTKIKRLIKLCMDKIILEIYSMKSNKNKIRSIKNLH